MLYLPSLSSTRRVGSTGLTCFALFALALCPVSQAHANVYATNIRIRGTVENSATTATVYVPCNIVQIDYLLNEPASAGVAVEIRLGQNVVRTLRFEAGHPGALRGTNTVVWDVKDEVDNFVPLGHYSVHITAASTGHGQWTQISDDFEPGNYVYAPRGIAVNRNTNSPYYGRVFVSNGEVGFNPQSEPGDRLGIRKLNADGSFAGDGGFGDGGWFLAGNNSLPSKIEVSDDDQVYVNDSIQDVVLRFDQNLSTGSRALFLRPDNWPISGDTNLGGPFIAGAGTNTQIWMADANNPGSVGIRRWTVASNGTIATNNLGLTIVRAGSGSDLNPAPYDVALDRSNRLYTIQFRDNSGDPADRVMRFPAYDESGTPQIVSDWKIGSGDDAMRGASGVAVDPTGTYVAVAFSGAGIGFGRTGGAVKIFTAADGWDVQTLTPAPFHDHTDVAWDNVGNLYVCDNWDSIWRVFSPPGANQATTVAIQTLHAGMPPLAPVLKPLSHANGQFFFTLSGRTNIDYVIEGSTDLQSWLPVLTNNDICATRLIVVNAPQSRQFYRAFTKWTE
jgi:hypothetical protein